jgi:hypothetical protein
MLFILARHQQVSSPPNRCFGPARVGSPFGKLAAFIQQRICHVYRRQRGPPR